MEAGSWELGADLMFHALDLGRIQSSRGESEIGELDVTRSIDEEVLGFEISV